MGKKPFEAKKVTEEDASDNPLYRYSYSQYVKDELNKSMMNDSKIPGISSKIFSQSSISNSKITETSKKVLLPMIRVLMFVLLLILLYSWNLKFFGFGDFQMINYAEEKCTELNRFDYSAEAWKEEMISSNMNNLKAKYVSDRQQEQVRLKVDKLQSILGSKLKAKSQEDSPSSG